MVSFQVDDTKMIGQMDRVQPQSDVRAADQIETSSATTPARPLRLKLICHPPPPLPKLKLVLKVSSNIVLNKNDEDVAMSPAKVVKSRKRKQTVEDAPSTDSALPSTPKKRTRVAHGKACTNCRLKKLRCLHYSEILQPATASSGMIANTAPATDTPIASTPSNTTPATALPIILPFVTASADVDLAATIEGDLLADEDYAESEKDIIAGSKDEIARLQARFTRNLDMLEVIDDDPAQMKDENATIQRRLQLLRT